MPDRVIVFIDYQNAHGWARRQFHPSAADPAVGHVDPLRLGRLLVARRKRPSRLEGVRVYRGRPNPDRQARSAAANDRQTVAWERSGAVTVIRRPLRYPGDWPTTPAAEKGIDVALAIDLVRLAMTKASPSTRRSKTSSTTPRRRSPDPSAARLARRRRAVREILTWDGAPHRCPTPEGDRPASAAAACRRRSRHATSHRHLATSRRPALHGGDTPLSDVPTLDLRLCQAFCCEAHADERRERTRLRHPRADHHRCVCRDPVRGPQGQADPLMRTTVLAWLTGPSGTFGGQHSGSVLPIVIIVVAAVGMLILGALYYLMRRR